MAGQEDLSGIARAGRDLTQNSDKWGLTKVTIPTPAAAKSPDSKPVLSCMVYHYSGTGTFVAPSAAAATDAGLPTTLATAVKLPVTNLNELSFFGTANDVIMIVWRT